MERPKRKRIKYTLKEKEEPKQVNEDDLVPDDDYPAAITPSVKSLTDDGYIKIKFQ